MKYLLLIFNRLTGLPTDKRRNCCSQPRLFAVMVLAAFITFPIISWADVEGQNLRSSTLRQYDFLIARINNGELYDPPAQTIINKIVENLETLSTYQTGSIKKREFEEVSDRLYAAVTDWENGQMIEARHHLLKSRALLASFSF
jgi:hypothetical protein